ncbi:MAG: C_GCAxxG_C_C family protein, partial [Dehalococcoidia bacterium]|nr:C_GCAxxG_C_C family protein [Dehalococcoidia bacterium]
GGGGLFGDSGCGAYNAGLLLIGLLKGRALENYSEEERASARCFEISRALHQKFIDEYGTIICRDIQTNLYGRPFWGVDPEEYAKVDAAGAHTTVGPVVVGNIARWVVQVIFEAGLLDELNELRRKSPCIAPLLPAEA